MRNLFILVTAFPLLSGCVGTIAKTAVDVVTLPVKVASAIRTPTAAKSPSSTSSA